MGRSSSKHKTQPSPTSSVDDSDYVPKEEHELEEAEYDEVEEQLAEEEENEVDEEENEENEDNEEDDEEEEELGYDPHWFVSQEAQDFFDSYWSKKAILCERGINLNHFSEEPADFKTLMAIRGWTTAMTFRDTTDPNLIQEFFANASLVESNKSSEVFVVSMVRG